MSRRSLAERLRVVMITDGSGDAVRIEAAVRAAVDGGVRAVQVREPGRPAAWIAALCERLRPCLRDHGGLLLVNDRADVAAAGFADGVHLGGRSLAVDRARAFLEDACIGASAHDPDELARAAGGGADYAFLSPVFPTASKPGAPPLGVERAREWTAGAGLPVVWLGGVTPERLRGVAAVDGLCGVAALSAFAEPSRARAMAEALGAAVAGILSGTWTRSG